MADTATIKVYVPDDEFVWVAADILPTNNDQTAEQVDVLITDDDYLSDDSQRSTPLSSIHSNPTLHRQINLSKVLKPLGLSSLPLQNANFPSEGVEDMCTLGYLHEGSILDNLKRRFRNKLPYTYTGGICLAVNPYTWLDNYTQELRETYSSHYRYQLPPHVYAISAQAYRGVSERHRNQSILVSGESGAGKTETVKILIGHIADIASKQGDTTIAKVLQANPLLESFGNAKTVRNDNSSRFGKFIDLQFDQNAILAGSECITYLLEKTRVVIQTSQERNYHIFYQLLSAPDALVTSLRLQGKKADYFTYTSEGDQTTNIIEGISDAEHFLQTMSELSFLDIDGELQSSLLRALAGILFLGQIRFEGVVGNEYSSPDDAMVSYSDVDAKNCLQACCEMLGVSIESFTKVVTTRSIDVQGQHLHVPLKISQAFSSRDALAKEIYSRVFQWLVHVVNFNTSIDLNSEFVNQSRHVIGLLDIFGFESFNVNRFEQLMINYANEKLQQKFTEDVFKTVQQEYRDEGLAWEDIGFKDNVEVLEFYEGKRGILATLNEECLIPQSSDHSFLSKIKTSCTVYSCFNVGLLTRDMFTVTHYAGAVSYIVTGFLDRNKDNLPEDLRALLSTSSNNLIATIFSSVAGATLFENTVDEIINLDRDSLRKMLLLDKTTSSQSEERSKLLNTVERKPIVRRDSFKAAHNDAKFLAKPPPSKRRASFMLAETVTMKFKRQLTSLMDAIAATEVQYVRCFKPNANKSAKEFNHRMVVEQLRSSGVIEAITVSRAAYPNHLTHTEFLARFSVLRSLDKNKSLQSSRSGTPIQTPCDDSSLLPQPPSTSQQCKAIMDMLLSQGLVSAEDLPAGGTKALLYELGKSRVYFALGVQEKLEALRTKSMLNDVTKVQKVFRGHQQYMKYKHQRACIIKIQSAYRMSVLRKGFQEIKRATITIQCAYRAMKHRKALHMRRCNIAATTIQSAARMMKPRKDYLSKKQAAAVLISVAMMRLQRRKYVVLRDKAREEAVVRMQLSIAQQALAEEASAREEMAIAIEELTRMNAELNEALLRQKQLFDTTLRELESTHKTAMTDAASLHEQQITRLQESVTGLTLMKQGLEEQVETLTDSLTSQTSDMKSYASIHTQTDMIKSESEPTNNLSQHQEYEQDRIALMNERERLTAEKQAFNAEVEEIRRLRALLADERKEIQRLKEELVTASLVDKVDIKPDKPTHLVVHPPSPPITPTAADANLATASDIFNRLESSYGLSTLMYTTTSTSKTKAKALPISIRKVTDSNGVTYIECIRPSHVPTPSAGIRASTLTDSKKTRFCISDLKMVQGCKGVSLHIPDSVSDEYCLNLVVEGQGEMNFVMASKNVRDFTAQALQSLIDGNNSEDVDSSDGDSNRQTRILAVQPPSTPPRSPAFINRTPRGSFDSGIAASLSLSRTKSTNSMLPRPTTTRASLVAKEPQPIPFNSPTWKDVDSPVAQYINGTAAKATIVMRGWAAKEDEKPSSSKAWTRRYLTLEKETRQIKYGVSEAFLSGFPGQLRGIVQLERGMKCSVSKGPSTWLTARNGSVLEIVSATNVVVLRMQVESDKEMQHWLSAIHAVVLSFDEDVVSAASTPAMSVATSISFSGVPASPASKSHLHAMKSWK